MIKLGITGGIGSGKSTVSRILELEGVPVYYADQRSKELLDSDSEVVVTVKQLFGDVYKDGRADRKAISALVFGDKELLKKLENILHPAVLRDFGRWCEEHKDAVYVVKEAAVLYESGADKQVDCVLTVSAPEELRVARCVARDGVDPAAIKARMKCQMTDNDREAKADFVILNDEKRELIPQVIRLDAVIREVARMNNELLESIDSK